MRSVRLSRRSTLAGLAIALLAACSKSDGGTGPALADHMVFLVPPSQTRSGQAIIPAIQVALVDASGTVVPGATASVTLALAPPIPAGGALTGTLTVQTVAGVATFSSLGIGPVATGYVLQATAAGLPTATSDAFAVFAPMPAAATSISVGSDWSCALTSGGGYCWGHNSGGELGINSDTARSTPSAILTSGIVFGQLAAGGSDTCGLTTPGGAAWCWGHNSSGAAGDGTTITKLAPVAVSGGHAFSSILAGDGTSCGLTSSGALWCWGANGRGQLGNGTTTNSPVPDSVHGGPYASASAGGSYACGVTSAGAAYCWGMNFSGGLGDGTYADKSAPVAVSGGIVFSVVKAGGGQTCGLTSPAGAAYCWGDNSYGQVGDGTTFVRSTPVAVSGGLFFSAISAGGELTCAIEKTTAHAYCWGHNNVGQLGNGTIADANVPTLVSGGRSFTQIGAGFAHACALEAGSGAVYCWGDNHQGALGNGTTVDSHVPTAVVP